MTTGSYTELFTGSRAYELAGANVHRLPIDIARIAPWHLPRALKRFRGLVDFIVPDLIHSHFVGTTLFMRLALNNRHDLPRLFQVPGPLHLEKWLPRRVEIATHTSADYWIATCRLTRDLYCRFGIPPDRVFLSYYGTSIDEMVCPGHRERTRNELQLSPTTMAVGLVAFMYPPRRWLGQKVGIKGHEDLIDALKILRNEGRDVAGVFVGGAWGNADWYDARLREYGAKHLGSSALFLGTRSDVPAIYEAVDIAVHPSHSENVGGAVESLLLGMPTIATDVGGFPDVVIEDETGILVPAKDPPALARAIVRMLDEPERAAEMSRAGQALCATLFDVKRTGCEVADIYGSVLRMHSRQTSIRAGVDDA